MTAKGPRDHKRIPVPFGEVGEISRQLFQVILNDDQSISNLKYQTRVHHILSGAAPVDVLAQVALASCGELAHHRRDGVTGALGVSGKFVKIEGFEIRDPHDLACGFLGNQTEFRFHFGKRNLELQVPRKPSLFREYLCNRIRQNIT